MNNFFFLEKEICLSKNIKVGIIKIIKLNLLPKHNAKNNIAISYFLTVSAYNPIEYIIKDQE